jgi:serine/threonine protein phosphatase PrpC
VLRFQGVGITDVGLVRDHNEDSAFLGPYVALVADGVGGSAAGEVASATVAYVVAALARQRQGDEPAAVLVEAVELAGKALADGVEADEQRTGMATTMTAVITDGERCAMAHVGDSRLYLFRGGVLSRVSHDHTFVQQLVDEGQLDAESVRRHPWRNVVLRSLHGTANEELADTADLLELSLAVGDRLLLCSDGLTDMVSDSRIAEVLYVPDAQSAAARLVEEALEGGGADNVTCLVFDVVDGPEVSGDGQVIGAMRDVQNIVDPASLRAN